MDKVEAKRIMKNKEIIRILAHALEEHVCVRGNFSAADLQALYHAQKVTGYRYVPKVQDAVDQFAEEMKKQKYKIFEYQSGNGLVWIRFFGYGFYAKNMNKQFLSFSERQWIKKTLKIGAYRIGFLYP